MSVVVRGRHLKSRNDLVSALVQPRDNIYVIHKSVTRPILTRNLCMGTILTRSKAGINSQEACANIVSELAKTCTLESCDWRTGVDVIQSFYPRPECKERQQVDCSMKLQQALHATCTSLISIRQKLVFLSQVLEGPTNEDQSQKDAVDLGEQCHQLASVLSILATTLASFSSSTMSSKSCNAGIYKAPFGVVSIHTEVFNSKNEHNGRREDISSIAPKRSLIPPTKGIEEMEEHDHTCFIYDCSQNAKAVVMQMILGTLAQGNSLLLVLQAAFLRDVFNGLSQRGVDTGTLLSTNRLSILDSSVYLHDQPAEERVTWIKENAEHILAKSGCNSISIVGDVGYPTDKPENVQQIYEQQLLSYETIVTNALYKVLPAECICLYERAAFPPQFLSKLILVHEFELEEY
ncbi:hypothetical protein Pelo_9288 [Pelomyxa schiedti]|nr:hypothetical protein Pelo_9288 [Pelomyxa schiedti]